jgi:hypothetical protein
MKNQMLNFDFVIEIKGFWKRLKACWQLLVHGTWVYSQLKMGEVEPYSMGCKSSEHDTDAS